MEGDICKENVTLPIPITLMRSVKIRNICVKTGFTSINKTLMKLGVLSYRYENLQWCAVALLSQRKSVDPREKGQDSARKRLEEWTHSFVR